MDTLEHKTPWLRIDPHAASGDAWLLEIAPWLAVGDPLADACWLALRAQGGGLRDVLPRLVGMAERGEASAQALLREMRQRPEWLDPALMRRGGEMVQRNFPMVIAALTYGSLPLVFAHPDAAAVFAGTGHFESSIPRRLNESATLFFGVTQSEQLVPDGRMWVECLRVRLIHAAIRQHVLAKSDWDVSARGVPINALQTASGPALFGTRLLAGMRLLGAQMNADEIAGHCMTWRYVSYLLGVPPALIAATHAEQDLFDARLMSLAFAPDDVCRTMVGILLDGLCTSPPTSRLARTTQVALMRALLGDAWADRLGVPLGTARDLRWLQRTLTAYGRLAAHRVSAPHALRLGRRVLGRMASHGLVELPPTAQAH